MEFINAKTIVTNSVPNNYYLQSEYVMNIYRGCNHECIYCYARSNYWTCEGTWLVPSQVLHFFGLKPCKNAFWYGSCSETEVSEQLYYEKTDNFECIRAKQEALRIIRDDLRKKKKPGVILTGGVSDPYYEKRFGEKGYGYFIGHKRTFACKR